MSVRIRLKRMGSKKRPFYRIIATDSRMPRDGRFIENVGYYNPMTNPPDIHVDEDALFKWFERGATPTENAAGLLRRVGSIQKWDLKKAGVTGEELETKVEAIKNQRAATAKRKDTKKSEAKSQKALSKEAAEAESKAAGEKPAEKAPVAEATPAVAEAPVAEVAPAAAEVPEAEAAPAAAEVPEAEAAPAAEEAPAEPSAEEPKAE